MLKVYERGEYIMDYLQIANVFSEEDKKFNREMVQRASNFDNRDKFLEKRGGKMRMYETIGEDLYAEKDYDFTSEILNDYRKKWGI